MTPLRYLLPGLLLLLIAACGGGDDEAPAVAPTPIVAASAPTATATQAPTPTVETENLSAADRVIAGLPEETPEKSAAVEGSPQEAVIARFEAEIDVIRTVKGRSQLLALQDFCPPDQRVQPEEITVEMGEERDALLRFVRREVEDFTVAGITALVTIPTEALVFFTFFGWSVGSSFDLAVEWSEIDGEWYHKSCAEDQFFGVPVSIFG